MKIYYYDDGHMTKMTAMSIYGKNDEPWLTLTYFTAR